MTNVKLGLSDWKRTVAREAQIPVRNRYYEQNPANQVEGSSLILRPGLRRFMTVGEGPIRGLYSQPGSFDTCLFAASGSELYRVDSDNTNTLIGTGLAGAIERSYISMAATGNIGSTPEYLFVADGSSLHLYMSNGYAEGTLSGTPANADTILIGGVYYQWTSGSVNVGTPAGTLANPWLVSLGDSETGPFEHMSYAVDNSGAPGVDYSTALVANPAGITAQYYTLSSLTIRANDAGVSGDTIATQIIAGSNINWTDTFLDGGGNPRYEQVMVPDNLGIISVCYIQSFVICVAAPNSDYKGRFFWIEPGETTIRPLNFATAENAPDPVYSARVVGDQFWLMGQSTTEIWYPTGNVDTPFARIQGQAFNRGVWEGTDVQIKENLILADSTGAVFNLRSGLERISNPSIEQRIRDAIREQAAGTP